MTDFYSEPQIIESSESLPPPSENYDAGASGASEPLPGSAETIQDIKDELFDKIGNDDSGDATDYVNERRDREAEERGETLSPERERERVSRFQKAMDAATRDVDELVTEHLDQWQHHDNELQRRDNSIRATTKYEMRADEFAKTYPDYKEVIQSTFSVLPLAEHVAEAFIHSPIGPEITYRLAHNVELIDEINTMSPDQLRVELARLEGIASERQANQASQRNVSPARRATRAAPPLKIHSGGAAPAFNAGTASMDEYVARRKAGWRG